MRVYRGFSSRGWPPVGWLKRTAAVFSLKLWTLKKSSMKGSWWPEEPALMARTPRSTWKPPREITPSMVTLLRMTLTLSPGFRLSLVR